MQVKIVVVPKHYLMIQRYWRYNDHIEGVERHTVPIPYVVSDLYMLRPLHFQLELPVMPPGILLLSSPIHTSRKEVDI